MKKTIIIIHEIYGITDNILSLKDILDRKGFNVILPSLYEDCYTGRDEQASYNKFFREVGIEKGCRIIDRVIARNTDSEIVLIGFSAGATIAWLHSADDRINSIIGIYGSRIRDYIDITPTLPSYLFFCEEKSFDIKPVIKALEQKKNVEVKTISGNHGFYNFSDTENKILIKNINEEIFRIIE
jgi:dienelactone hydrolase